MTTSSDRPVFNDRYEIHSRIGRGGMADVFLARDRLLDRPVAVKVLFPEFATDLSFVERFRREAQAAANLAHPNIVGVYDWGKQGSTYFIVMEYVNGRTLADILKAEGRLLPERVADISIDVAAALGHAHKNGVVHRDVKPANILIAANGAVNVADFGIARALNTATEANLTQAGAVMGTATYFSPEQAQGAATDPRSDLYSLGIVMYEAVTGRPPFTGDNPVAIAYKQVHDAPTPPTQVDPDLPRGFEAIVMKLLAKNPVNRYSSADELIADLKRYRDGMSTAAESAAATGALGGAADAATVVGQGADTTIVSPVRGADPTRAQRAVDAAGTQVMRRTGVVPATVAGSSRAPKAVPVRPDQVYRRTDYVEPARGGRTGWWVAGIIGLIALLVVGGLVAYNLTRDDDPPALASVEVPDVVALPQAEAEQTLRDAQLVPVVVLEESTTVPAGTVISQDPAASEPLDEGSNVTINVSSGTTQLPLPNLVGGTEQQAREALDGLGLPEPQVTPEESADQPAGTVLAQDPPEGLVPAGTVVTLTVSSGVGKVQIPNVVNLDAVQATAQLTSAELVVASTQEPSDSVPAGRVIRTEPGVGESVDKGSTVTLVVSTGAAPVPVPDVGGMTESAARDALQQAGFLQQVVRIDVPFDSPQAGLVISQNPTAGTEYGKGQTVTINVGQAQPAPTTTTSSSNPPSTTTVGTTTTT